MKVFVCIMTCAVCKHFECNSKTSRPKSLILWYAIYYIVWEKYILVFAEASIAVRTSKMYCNSEFSFNWRWTIVLCVIEHRRNTDARNTFERKRAIYRLLFWRSIFFLLISPFGNRILLTFDTFGGEKVDVDSFLYGSIMHFVFHLFFCANFNLHKWIGAFSIPSYLFI